MYFLDKCQDYFVKFQTKSIAKKTKKPLQRGAFKWLWAANKKSNSVLNLTYSFLHNIFYDCRKKYDSVNLRTLKFVDCINKYAVVKYHHGIYEVIEV